MEHKRRSHHQIADSLSTTSRTQDEQEVRAEHQVCLDSMLIRNVQPSSASSGDENLSLAQALASNPNGPNRLPDTDAPAAATTDQTQRRLHGSSESPAMSSYMPSRKSSESGASTDRWTQRRLQRLNTEQSFREQRQNSSQSMSSPVLLNEGGSASNNVSPTLHWLVNNRYRI